MKPLPRWGKWTAWILPLLLVAAGIAAHRLLAWKRFEEVRPGILYRSGMLRDWQLRDAFRRYGIRTVFSFTFTDHEAEQQTCGELGIRYHFCYLPGDGVGPDEPYLRFLEVAAQPANHPILVHCSAGVQRTGGAVALYRVLVQGWDFDRATAEMIDRGNEGRPAQIEQLAHICRRLRPPPASAGSPAVE